MDRPCHYEPYSSTNNTASTTAASSTTNGPGTNGGLFNTQNINVRLGFVACTKLGGIANSRVQPELMKRIKTIESQLARLSGQGLPDILFVYLESGACYTALTVLTRQMPNNELAAFPDINLNMEVDEIPSNQEYTQLPAESPKSQRRPSTSMAGTAESVSSNQS